MKIEHLEAMSGSQVARSKEESRKVVELLKRELRSLPSEAEYSAIIQRRTAAEETRFCEWDCQSTDGRKHRDDMDGKEPFPFEGASDARIRVADGVINERVALLVLATTRAVIGARGITADDEERASRLRQIMRWAVQNQMQAMWRREWTKLANYQEGDGLGCAAMGVYWDRQIGLEPARVDMGGILQAIQEAIGQPLAPEEVNEVVALFQDEERRQDAVRVLGVAYPDATASDRGRMAKEIRMSGATMIDRPYVRVDRPVLEAYRIYDDLWFSGFETDIQSSRVVFVRKWMTRAQMAERSAGLGWSKDFVDGLVGSGDEKAGHGGKSWFDDNYKRVINGDGSISGGSAQKQSEHQFEVITAFYRAADENGATAVYTCVFSGFLDEPAAPPQILGYEHGCLPIVFFWREALGPRLVDSRGVSELAMTHQDALKRLHDSFQDHTSLSTVPPLRVPKLRSGSRVVIAPLAHLEERRPNEYGWMSPPEYPRTNADAQAEIRRQVDEYFGRTNPGVPGDTVTVLRQMMVDTWLDGVRQVMTQIVQLCQQFLGDEVIARLTNGQRPWISRGRAEIQGQFDIELSFDVRDVSLDYVKEKAAIIRDMITPLDTGSTIRRDRLVAYLMRSLDASLADEVVVPQEEADYREVDDEQTNFAKIVAGVEPPMMAEGQNFGLRLRVIEDIYQKNPASVERMDEVSRKILDKRVEHLRFMVQQQENAQIGRVGARPALQQ